MPGRQSAIAINASKTLRQRVGKTCTWLLLLVGCLLLTSCGFQARQPLQLADDFQPIYVEANDSLNRELRRRLQAELLSSNDLSLARSRLVLDNIDIEERDLAITSAGRNAEYLLIMRAELRWNRIDQDTASNTTNSTEQQAADTAANTSLLRSRLTAETSFVSNPFNPSAEAAERKLMLKRLEKRLVQNAIQQLSLTAQ